VQIPDRFPGLLLLRTRLNHEFAWLNLPMVHGDNRRCKHVGFCAATDRSHLAFWGSPVLGGLPKKNTNRSHFQANPLLIRDRSVSFVHKRGLPCPQLSSLHFPAHSPRLIAMSDRSVAQIEISRDRAVAAQVNPNRAVDSDTGRKNSAKDHQESSCSLKPIRVFGLLHVRADESNGLRERRNIPALR
jgi:hypothetical protein